MDLTAVELGELLRWCRLQNGNMKQQTLADMLRVDRSIISRHENGMSFDLDLVKRWGIATGFKDIVNSGIATYIGFEEETEVKRIVEYEHALTKFKAASSDLLAIG